MEDFLDKQFTDEQILTAEIRISEVQSNSEGDMVMNVFNLFINYTARIDSDVLPEDLVAAPFFTSESRASYVRRLNNITGSVLELVTASSPLLGDGIPVAETGSPTTGPTVGPTSGPTVGPTSGPTAGPTSGPTDIMALPIEGVPVEVVPEDTTFRVELPDSTPDASDDTGKMEKKGGRRRLAAPPSGKLVRRRRLQ